MAQEAWINIEEIKKNAKLLNFGHMIFFLKLNLWNPSTICETGFDTFLPLAQSQVTYLVTHFFNIFFLLTFVIVFSSVQAKQYPVAIFTKIIKTNSPIVGISKLQNLNVEYPTYCTQRFCYNFILLLLCKWLCPTKTLESGNRTIPQENLNIQRS